MQLRDRGSSYTQKQSPIATRETGIFATFLGQRYQVRRSLYPNSIQLDSTRKYRGIVY